MPPQTPHRFLIRSRQTNVDTKDAEPGGTGERRSLSDERSGTTTHIEPLTQFAKTPRFTARPRKTVSASRSADHVATPVVRTSIWTRRRDQIEDASQESPADEDQCLVALIENDDGAEAEDADSATSPDDKPSKRPRLRQRRIEDETGDELHSGREQGRESNSYLDEDMNATHNLPISLPATTKSAQRFIATTTASSTTTRKTIPQFAPIPTHLSHFPGPHLTTSNIATSVAISPPRRPAFLVPYDVERFTTGSSNSGDISKGVWHQPPQSYHSPLPDVFSPSRKGQRYIPGGMADEVRRLVIETGQSGMISNSKFEGSKRGSPKSHIPSRTGQISTSSTLTAGSTYKTQVMMNVLETRGSPKDGMAILLGSLAVGTRPQEARHEDDNLRDEDVGDNANQKDDKRYGVLLIPGGIKQKTQNFPFPSSSMSRSNPTVYQRRNQEEQGRKEKRKVLLKGPIWSLDLRINTAGLQKKSESESESADSSSSRYEWIVAVDWSFL